MSERFIKFIPSEEALHLARKHPKAFILLMFIAERARRENGHPDGLNVGECHVGDWESMGLTRQEYRTALKVLCLNETIIILETNRTRQKSTTGSTTAGTMVRLLDSRVWDINSEDANHRLNHCPTTAQPLPNHKQEGRRKKKKEKEDHPSIPSGREDPVSDEFSSKEEIEIGWGVFLSREELDECIAIKGSFEEVKYAIGYIQTSKRRKHPIMDWPNALRNWKVPPRTVDLVQKNHDFAKSVKAQFAHVTRAKEEMQLGPTYFELGRYPAQETIDFKEKGFRERVVSKLRKMSYPVENL